MDASLQTLERRWRQTGAVDDEARWLLARVRAGDLPRERLLFAADLGHPPALTALDRPVDVDEAVERLRGGDPSPQALGRLGREGLVRVTLAAVGAHADLVDRFVGPVHPAARAALVAVQGWLDATPPRPTRPLEPHARALFGLQGGPARPQRTAVLLARRLLEGVTTSGPRASRALELTLRILGDWGSMLEERRASPPPGLGEALGGPRPRDGYEQALLRRVQADVVPWALQTAGAAVDGSARRP
ncbi:MAG: hypothetical protein KF878_30625 [Planctomycetes bacterium]|nr:hypothetical protein [Planctomycetota bacterium]